jgi:hypothetical protein
MGIIKLPASPNTMDMDSWADSICGILQDDSWDSLEELKKYKKEDLEMEKREV